MSAKTRLQEFFQKSGTKVPEYTFYREGGKDHSPKWRCEVNITHEKRSTTLSSECCLSKKEASKQAAELGLVWYQEGVKSDKAHKVHSICLGNNKDISHTFMLLDLENVPHGYRDICEQIGIKDESRVSIVGFYSYSSAHIRRKVRSEMDEHRYALHLVEAQSSRSDAADIGLCLWVGKMMSKLECETVVCKQAGTYYPTFYLDSSSTVGRAFPQKEYIFPVSFGVASKPTIRIMIVTIDHFGKALAELINSQPSSDRMEIKWKAECYYSVEEIVE